MPDGKNWWELTDEEFEREVDKERQGKGLAPKYAKPAYQPKPMPEYMRYPEADLGYTPYPKEPPLLTKVAEQMDEDDRRLRELAAPPVDLGYTPYPQVPSYTPRPEPMMHLPPEEAERPAWLGEAAQIGLKGLEYAFEPFRQFGMRVTARPFIETAEMQEEQTRRLRERIEAQAELPIGERIKAAVIPTVEEFKYPELREKYEALPIWQQMMAELPALAAVPLSFGGLSRLVSRVPVIGRFLAKGLTPAVRGEEAVGKAIAYIPKKISQKRLESQIYTLFKKLPTDDELKVILTEDWYRRVARDLSKIPGVKAVIRKINPSGVADSETEKAIMRHLALLETADNKGNAIMALLQRYGDDIALFNVTPEGLCRGIVVRAKFKGKIPLKDGMPALGDVLEYPSYFVLSAGQKSYIKTLWKLEDTVKSMLKDAGVSLNEIDFKEGTHWVHRVVVGKRGEQGVEFLRQGSFRPGAKKPFERTRYHHYMLEGVENKVVYGLSANQYLRTYYDGAMRMIADKRLANAVKGATALERMPMAIREEAIGNALKVRNYTKLLDRVRKIKADWKAPPITLKAMERWDAEVAAEVQSILADTAKTLTQRKGTFTRLIKGISTKLDMARREHQLTRIKYKRAKEWATKPHEGEAYINMPFAGGRVYPKETADTVMKYYGDVAPAWLKAMNNMSSASRTAVATFDFSAPFIQGLPVLGHSPLTWSKSTLRMFLSFFNKGTHTNYMVKHAATTQEMAANRCIVFGTEGMHEMVEAMPMIGRVIGKTPLIGKTLQRVFEETYGRFGVAFSSWGDTTRIMLWESMRDGWARRGQLNQLAQLINHMTGVVSTRALGVTSSQRAAESGFLFFAPRYTRAGFALFGDILKGGYTSANAIRAIGGFLGGGTAFYVGACAALGQEPNLDPSSARFMTIKVGTQHIGVGGFLTSAVRFAADVANSAASIGENEPIDFLTLDRYKNPFIRFLYSKTAPMTNLAMGLATRKDYLGRKLETPEEYVKWLADFMIPIAMQTVTTQEKKANWQALLVEMVGGRTFPESVWEEVRSMRDGFAMDDYGIAYDELDIHAKRMLEANHPEIKQMVGEAEAEWAKWYPDEPRVRYNKEMDESDNLYSDQLWQSVKETQLGERLTGELIEKIDDFGLRHAERNNEIRKDYPEVLEQFDRWRERDKQDWLLFDQAYDEYIQDIVVPNWEDEFYNFKFDEYRYAQQVFQDKWGEDVYNEVRETMWLGDDIPPLFLELKAAREQWSDYYQQPEGAARAQWRASFPMVEAELFFWGRVTGFQNPESSRLVLALMEKYDVPQYAIKGFKQNDRRYVASLKYHSGIATKRDMYELLSPSAYKLWEARQP